MSVPSRRRLDLSLVNSSTPRASRDLALPSPMSDLASNLGAASISSSPVRRISSSSSDEADTPTTTAVLGRTRAFRLLREVSLNESPTPEGRRRSASSSASASLRRHKSLPLRQRLLAAASENKENVPLLSPSKQNCSFEFSSPKRKHLSDRVGSRAADGSGQCRQPFGQVQAVRTQTRVSLSFQPDQAETVDHCSQDSGYDASEREDFRFAAPTAPPPRRVRSSASTGSCSPPFGSPSSGGLLPAVRRADSDGFLDTIDLDTMDESAMPAGLQELLSAPILNSPAAELAEPGRRLGSFRRSLSLVEHTNTPQQHTVFRDCVPVPGRLGQFKRPEPPPGGAESPIRHKRLCSVAESPRGFELQRSESHRLSPVTERVRVLQRCFSESEATIKRALQRSCQDPDLIGDCSRPYALPLVRSSRVHDLKAISTDTMAALLRGEFSQSVASFSIIDCRYPYEFDGGHIRSAVNLYTRDDLHSHLLANRQEALVPEAQNKRHVLIFHCEFSSERGPNMYRFLRAQDRNLNKSTYPALHYPEMYVLEGGYKSFFETHPDHCHPRAYKPMNKEGHESDLKHFRAKSKSWAGDSRARAVSKRMFL